MNSQIKKDIQVDIQVESQVESQVEPQVDIQVESRKVISLELDVTDCKFDDWCGLAVLIIGAIGTLALIF